MTTELKRNKNTSFKDHRGYYWTTWKKNTFKKIKFNHDKFSISKKKVLRGLHCDFFYRVLHNYRGLHCDSFYIGLHFHSRLHCDWYH